MDKGKRISGTERTDLGTQLKAAYEGGASIRALAQAHGRSYGFVHRLLTETGVALRSRGGIVGTSIADVPGRASLG
ncbi:helix-turn-helix domain-containing protein [Kitasatospora indigofera]|uniref:helix-turn-helix domain-containing protein n=1 Tax=Kitasatospora indigofera TaxID=67307 RepID=UPI0036978C73